MDDLRAPLKVLRRTATSVEQIHADVLAYHINSRFKISPEGRRSPKRTHTSLILDEFQIQHFDQAGGETSGVRAPSYWLGFVTHGSVRISHRGKEAVALPSGRLTSTGDTGDRMTVESSPGSRAYTIDLSPGLILRCGQGLLGDDFKLQQLPAFAGELEFTNPGQALVRNIRSVFWELKQLEEIGLGALAASAFTELIGNLAIAAMLPQLFEERSEAASTAKIVERAEEIIRGRAHEPLSIQEVALALGVTVRTLQSGFRKHRGMSPLQFLINSRLALARERLANPDVRSNVQSVAMGCGFLSMSKFALRYKSTFGEAPSVTLARARR